MCCLDLPHNRPQRFIPLTRSHETTCRLLSLYFAVSLNFTTTTTKQGHFGLSYARITQVVVSNLLVHSGYCLLVVRGKGRGGGGQVRPGPPPPPSPLVLWAWFPPGKEECRCPFKWLQVTCTWPRNQTMECTGSIDCVVGYYNLVTGETTINNYATCVT